jgi:hypothetical protein
MLPIHRKAVCEDSLCLQAACRSGHERPERLGSIRLADGTTADIALGREVEFPRQPAQEQGD